MKRYALPLALALTFTGVAVFAQTPDTTQPPAPIVRRHAPNPHKEAKHLAKQLTLTPDQESEIEPVLADRDQKLAAARADTTISEDAQKAQIRRINKNFIRKITTILTPVQLHQFMTTRHERHGHHDQEPPTAPPPSA